MKGAVSLVKTISVLILITFLTVILISPVKADIIYRESASSYFSSLRSNRKLSYERQLKEIRDRQNSGKAMFWSGIAVNLIYIASLNVGGEKKFSLSYLFGMPLVGGAIAWLGLNLSVSANQEEVTLRNQYPEISGEEVK